MLENFRKTLAYKFCGYSFWGILILTFIVSLPNILVAIASCWLPGMGFKMLDSNIMWFQVINLAIFVILTIVALLTKPSEIKFDKVADMGYALMFIVVLIAFCNMPYYLNDYQKEKLYMNNVEVVQKESCKIINSQIPEFVKTSNAEFTGKELANTISQMNLIYDVHYEPRENMKESLIGFRYESPTTYDDADRYISLFKSNNIGICNLNEKNCYISLGIHKKLREQGYDCTIYYDKNSTVPTEATLKFINN